MRQLIRRRLIHNLGDMFTAYIYICFDVFVYSQYNIDSYHKGEFLVDISRPYLMISSFQQEYKISFL